MTPGHLMLFRSVDLQDGDTPDQAGIWLDLAEGFAEPAEIRGTNLIVPSRDYQVVMPKRADFRMIVLNGFVRGLGGDHDERRDSWRTSTDTLMAVMDRTLDPGELSVTGPYLGIPDGEEWTISASLLRIVPGLVQSHMSFQRWSFTLVAYDDWTQASS